MTFDELLDQVIEMLQRRGRVSYQALKRQFDLDDAYLTDLKAEIVEVHRLAVDQDGSMLVWTGEPLTATAPVGEAARPPQSSVQAAPPPAEPLEPDAERRRLQLTRDDTPEEKLRKLEKALMRPPSSPDSLSRRGREERLDVVPLLAIPATLQDSLMARLDRLSTARAVAQLGAVLGREFAYELIGAVALMDEATLQRGLAQLVDAELLYQRGRPPQARYLFKHALIQEAAYQSLLMSTRQQYHQRSAQVLAEQFPEIVETQPELVAHHYTEAGLGAQALPYWQRAGEQALQRSANLETIQHLTKGLALLAMLPETPARAQQEFDLQIALGSALMATKGLAAQGQGVEGVAQIRQGLAAWRAAGAKMLQSYALALLAEAYGYVGEAEEGLRVLAEALALLDTTGERFYTAELYRLKGELLLALSSEHQVEAETCFRQALDVARHQQAKSLELLAATSLSRLRQHQGKHTEARELLAPIYGWFTEGFDTADLREAKALLEALA